MIKGNKILPGNVVRDSREGCRCDGPFVVPTPGVEPGSEPKEIFWVKLEPKEIF